MPALVPTLDGIAESPDKAQGLPRRTLLDLANRAMTAHAVILANLMVAADEAPAEVPDRLLTGVEFAKLLGRHENYVYAHKDEWPFTIRGVGRTMFSLKGYEKWLAERDGRGYVSPRARAQKRGA